jgi:DNA integrity scanning protein DisA with diadenylate cyclase activity
VLKTETVREKIIQESDPRGIVALLDAQEITAPGRKVRLRSQVLISHARRMRTELGLKAVILAIERRDDLKLLKGMSGRKNFIVVTSSARIQEDAKKLVPRTILLPQMAFGRSARIRFVALMAFTKGFIRRGDAIAVLAGTGSGGIDGVVILEIGSEFGRFVSTSGDMSDGAVPGVLERVMTLATELAADGREGKPVGTIFVVGDPAAIASYSQQMVMNPFRGYPEDQRNILDPTLKETLKEFAVIDGAFVVRWDGVVMAAGTYLKVAQDANLPGGYGSRHRAGCAITEVTNSIAVVVSQSSGEVTIFRKGAVMLSLSKGAS